MSWLGRLLGLAAAAPPHALEVAAAAEEDLPAPVSAGASNAGARERGGEPLQR